MRGWATARVALLVVTTQIRAGRRCGMNCAGSRTGCRLAQPMALNRTGASQAFSLASRVRIDLSISAGNDTFCLTRVTPELRARTAPGERDGVHPGGREPSERGDQDDRLR